jgi:hypothetical protein
MRASRGSGSGLPTDDARGGDDAPRQSREDSDELAYVYWAAHWTGR